MADDEHDSTWMSVAEYCELRRIRPNTARDERRRGAGPPFVQGAPGGTVIYRRATVERWLEKLEERERKRMAARRRKENAAQVSA